MGIFGDVFGFVLKKLINKNSIKFVVGILIILFIIIYDGMSGYQTFSKDVKKFQKSEIEKVNSYARYDQYAGYGVRLILVPSAFGIITMDSLNIKKLANVNTGERLNLFNLLKGRDYFKINEYMNIRGIALILGALFGILLGYKTVKNMDYLKFVESFSSPGKCFFTLVLSNLVLLNLISVLLIFVSFLLPLINSSLNLINENFILFALAVVLMISFFFSVGAIVGAKKANPIILAVLYFILVLFIPWTLEKVNRIYANNIQSIFEFEQISLNVLMHTERALKEKFGTYTGGKDEPSEELKRAVRDVFDNELKEVVRLENKRKDEIYNKIFSSHKVSSFYPISFYIITTNEIGCGGRSFIEFYNFSQKRKKEFIEYYFRKHYIENTGIIESFIKGDENLFFAQSRLPYFFGLGVGLTVLYIVGLLLLAYRLHLKGLKSEIKGVEVDINFEDKNTVFVLCKNKTIKEGIFNHYKQKDAVCIAKINPDDFRMNGIKPVDLLKHLCKIAGVEEKKARENLGIMEVDIDTAENSNETLLTIYVAVNTAREQELIVIDDLFKKESRQFETRVFRLLSRLETAGKKLIYLSTEMYNLINGLNEQIHIDTFGVFPISLEKVTLR